MRLLVRHPAHHIEPIANLFSPMSGSSGLAFDYNLVSGSAYSSIPQPSELDLAGYPTPSLATNSSLRAPLINSETGIPGPEQSAGLQGMYLHSIVEESDTFMAYIQRRFLFRIHSLNADKLWGVI